MPGPYQIQAAIAAVHADAATADATDWSQIVQLYDQLLQHTPTPVVGLNRAIAIAIAELDLDNYHLFHAARGDLLQRLDRLDDAAEAFDRSLDLATNEVERDLLRKRRNDLADL